MEKKSLYDIADFWNGFADEEEVDFDTLNKMIEDNGFVNDLHEQWGICHSDTGKVALSDDLTAYVIEL